MKIALGIARLSSLRQYTTMAGTLSKGSTIVWRYGGLRGMLGRLSGPKACRRSRLVSCRFHRPRPAPPLSVFVPISSRRDFVLRLGPQGFFKGTRSW